MSIKNQGIQKAKKISKQLSKNYQKINHKQSPSKLAKINRNYQKLSELVKNYPKLSRIAQYYSKLTKNNLE